MTHLFGDLPKYKITSEMEEKEQEWQELMLKNVKRGFSYIPQYFNALNNYSTKWNIEFINNLL